MRDNHYVFLTGTNDFNLAETRKVYQYYADLGLENIKLMVVPHMGHGNPSADKYEQAIRFLDSGLAE